MADVTAEVLNDAGTWLTVSQWDGAELLALVHASGDPSDSGVTVYWPARSDGSMFAAFFERILPRVKDFHPTMRAIERRLAFATGTGEVTNLVAGQGAADDAFFLRFEHLQVGSNYVEHPVLIVWTNLEAGRLVDVPSDAGGVRFETRHLPLIQEPLATLIAKSSAQEPDLGSVVAMLDELGSYLDGGTEPMVAVA